MVKRTANAAICLILLGAAIDPAIAEQWDLCQVWPRPSFDYPRPERGDDAPIVVSADSAEDLNNEVMKLFGDVLVQQPDEQMHADEAFYYHSTNSFDAFGNVRYDTPEFSSIGSEAHIQADTSQGQFDMAEFFIYARHARGSSKKIMLEGKDYTVLKTTSYTTCDKDAEDWSIRASTVELNHATGMGNAYNARLNIGPVPVFYIPFMRFPITDERMTGLLPPSWGSSDLGGNEFSQPIYINLHPQLDATITPHNYTQRGLKWENEVRYLSKLGEGTIYTENINDEVYGDSRSFYHYTHAGRLGTHWSDGILYNRASDGDYLNDFGNSLSVTSITYLERNAQLQYDDNLQQLFMQVQDYQILDETLPPSSQPYRRLPQIKHELSPPMLGPILFDMKTELVRFQREESINGNRININPAISLPYERPAGFITPKLSLFHTVYQLQDERDTTTPAIENLRRSVPVSSIDSGIYLERDSKIGTTDYLTTLEPRLFYLYVPYRDQSDLPLFDTSQLGFSQSYLFSENRFSGYDRIGDTNQLTLSLGSRLLKAEDGKEILYGSIGKIAYFEDRRVGLNGNILDTSHESDIIVEGKFKPTDPLNITAKILWDTHYELITERDVGLQYMSDNQHIINLRYRDQGNRLTAPDAVSKEIDLSVLWPLGTRWSMMARRYHSIPDDRTIEKMLGLEYNSCCWAIRAVRRATFVEDTSATEAPFGNLRYSWYVQVELKGLSNIGQRIDELMEQQILGFKAVN